MLVAILLTLIILWVLGYLPLPFSIPNFVLFVINGREVTLWNILIFLVLIWLISILPSPFREIGAVLFVLWILSVLGIFSIFAIASLPAILLAAIIIGLVAYLFTR